MYPIIFQKGFITIYSYGLMIALGCLTVIFFAVRDAKKLPFTIHHLLTTHHSSLTNFIYDLCFGCLLWGIIGARIFYVFLNFKYFLENPIEIIMINHGGLVFYGGFIFASIFFVLYLKIKKQNFFDIVYIILPYLPLGHALGRIGCLLNGCCYGSKTTLPWGINIAGTLRHPVQIYEAFSNVLICLLLLFFRKKNKKSTGFLYLLFYGFFRFSLEFFRGDEVTVFYGLRVSQWISIFMVIIGFAGLIKNKK